MGIKLLSILWSRSKAACRLLEIPPPVHDVPFFLWSAAKALRIAAVIGRFPQTSQGAAPPGLRDFLSTSVHHHRPSTSTSTSSFSSSPSLCPGGAWERCLGSVQDLHLLYVPSAEIYRRSSPESTLFRPIPDLQDLTKEAGSGRSCGMNEGVFPVAPGGSVYCRLQTTVNIFPKASFVAGSFPSPSTSLTPSLIPPIVHMHTRD
ncbi:hypothetical protein CPSG_00613 [Coccidioides posadasii str. Silveira]|uniref:Uncharacterized protein n=1 Tax=Coccidioides posadasii (strain RMSCC 757 / Silveira) TaxID=443226 RepID=E9CSQ4_COCPS|nr:hypothetical protein CPSG_00613 [Coccidioides posadasii str. Silveira]